MKIALVIFLAFLVSNIATDPQIIPIPGGLNGSGFCTTYWDCCKPSCSWTGNLPSSIASPVDSCAIDGKTVIDANAPSGCMEDGSGEAYMCTDQQPWIINDTLSLGFAAGSFTGGTDYSQCCSCFLISFMGSDKQMAVQVTNAGGDLLYNQFDIAMPGGGVGLFNGCTAQWNAPEDGWGLRYGGVQTLEECDQLPSVLQPGCKWKFQFLQDVNMANITFQEIECPQELTALSNCS